MQLEKTNKGFRHIIKVSKQYVKELIITPDTVPSGCLLLVNAYNETDEYESQFKLTIYKDYPFNENVKALFKTLQGLSEVCSTANYANKFAIDSWTPEKLAEMQAKVKERQTRYNELCTEYRLAREAYNEALELQKKEIERVIVEMQSMKV
mgnify:CR=1 FL=1